MKSSKVLIVDDEPDIRTQIARWLNEEGYQTEEAKDGDEALNKVSRSDFNVVLLDLKLPTKDGFQVLKQLNRDYPDICVIILTAYGGAEITKRALKEGAFDFFDKTKNYSTLLPRIESAIERYNATREQYYQFEEERQRHTFDSIIGNSSSIHQTLALVKKVAKTEATVLILGESGTGKELVAKAIHYNSLRSNKPWIVADCSTITPSLIESELFGHEKGAFTGAHKRKKGKFERAEGGTLFIDEIGELNKSLQMNLLRFLQEGTIERVGGEEVIKIDARVLAATAVDLKLAIEKNKFREDLFYRLNVVTINIPPLRERKDDVPLLVDHFIKVYSRKNLKEVNSISSNALRLLENYDFPGNVRELENTINRAVVLTNHREIEPEAIIFDPINSDNKLIKQYFDLPIKEFGSACERDYIIYHLKKNNWNISNTAIKIGIDRTNLTLKMKKYGIKK